jgi:hypothetical protein
VSDALFNFAPTNDEQQRRLGCAMTEVGCLTVDRAEGGNDGNIPFPVIAWPPLASRKAIGSSGFDPN